ncbi:amidohydrolase family protein [Pseudidiomarina sediminum]|uniref:amidohydrolase family protein n=1 Tax=Pseudidiomarina sediminum TaxID=431675 RepID=UPI001C976807|nr:amidohydrolase family protein [Pseudidiomarina sediminum]MBY6064143.1 amidohydrolase family protein [Pseudidiomarina sediminum]
MRCLILILGLFSANCLAEQATLYKHATLIVPSENKRVSDAYFVVQDGRFVALGQGRIPVEYVTLTEQVDLNQQFVSAGMIDTHAHMTLGAVTFEVVEEEVKLRANQSLDIAKWNAQQLLVHGVTSVRDPGGDTTTTLAYRNAQRAAQVTGPRAWVAGSILNTAPFAGLVEAVDSTQSLRDAIDTQAAQGVDFIKLYTGLSEAELAAGVAQAKQHGLPVIAHLDEVSWQRGAALGVDHLVHAMPVSPQLLAEPSRQDYLATRKPTTIHWAQWHAAVALDDPLMTQLYTTLVQQNVAVDPTLIVFYNAFFGESDAVTQHPELPRVHPEQLANWRSFYHFTIGWSPEDFRLATNTWSNVLAFVKRLYDEGVRLSVGTDLGNPWVIPGESYHQELQLLVDAGLTPMQVLSLATVNGAEVLGQSDQLGRIAEGYQADFVVFSKDPSTAIEHSRSITAVYQGGARVH